MATSSRESKVVLKHYQGILWKKTLGNLMPYPVDKVNPSILAG